MGASAAVEILHRKRLAAVPTGHRQALTTGPPPSTRDWPAA